MIKTIKSLKENRQLSWVLSISFLYIIINTILIGFEFYWLSLLPAVLFIVYLYFFSLDKIIFLIVFFTPLAVNIRDLDVGVGVSLPTEPLLAGVLLIFIYRLFRENNIDIKLVKHPVSIAIYINLIWIFFTSITSELPIVSFKFLMARLWFVVPIYFLGVPLFKKYFNIKLFSWIYVVPLIGVIFYSIYNLYTWGFEEKAAHWVMTPFFNDHTAYGAILAMFVPIFTGFIFYKNYNRTLKLLSAIVLVILIIALILSVSRAAWISIVAAIGVFGLVYFRVNFKWVFTAFVIVIALFFSFENEIVNKLAKNKQDSSADLAEHLQSISNITSDASNLERLNRWQAAFRMFNERPIVGWGPGTYQFVYAPFQNSQEKTIISTNVGNRGNAHSEYIGPLCEQGIMGLLIIIFILSTIFYTALKVYKYSSSAQIRLLSLIHLLALVTYFVHGFLNNFLDSDKASVPVWGFAAIIVALDLYHKQKNNPVHDDGNNNQ